MFMSLNLEKRKPLEMTSLFALKVNKGSSSRAYKVEESSNEAELSDEE